MSVDLESKPAFCKICDSSANEDSENEFKAVDDCRAAYLPM
jgi:hypothetical protein